MSQDRPTGIIRTLPYFGGIEKGEPEDRMRSRAYKRMMRAFRMMATEKSEKFVYIALAQKPVHDVLHCYILVQGKVIVRANISHYVEGKEIGPVECWDDSVRDVKWWAVLTGPVSFAREPILMRGFQGFRYVKEPLW